MEEIKDQSIAKKIADLKKQYDSDKDAQDEINRALESILYDEKRKDDEHAMIHVQTLEDFLHDWY